MNGKDKNTLWIQHKKPKPISRFKSPAAQTRQRQYVNKYGNCENIAPAIDLVPHAPLLASANACISSRHLPVSNFRFTVGIVRGFVVEVAEVLLLFVITMNASCNVIKEILHHYELATNCETITNALRDDQVCYSVFRDLLSQLRDLLSSLPNVSLRHICRTMNTIAHDMAKKALKFGDEACSISSSL
ncbi:hypothetical protein G4B88_014249 [Cannabis sativa]|uniref:RNase H type-1 domain-containing protein n=1 Tax=Cannabis sativa TaxID=3483 RepID=A0A7J6EWW5_CANSA|nr:hypothetical protein G4B88_014249 [Cannabis sativa]